MLSCTTVLHLALVSASLVMTTILLQWCRAKILLHIVPYPNYSVTNGNRPQNIVSLLVPYQIVCYIWCHAKIFRILFGTGNQTKR